MTDLALQATLAVALQDRFARFKDMGGDRWQVRHDALAGGPKATITVAFSGHYAKFQDMASD